MDELLQSVLNKDPEASLLARQIGPSANPELIELTQHEDSKVRRIALYCLNETGGADAAMAMAASLLDDEPQVQSAALKGLINHPDPVVYQLLLKNYAKIRDPLIRREVPLILGRMEGKVQKSDLKEKLTAEKAPEAKEGWLVVLTRDNDQEARTLFLQGLHASKGRPRARFLEYCRYIGAPWLLKEMLPLLDDQEPMIRIGVDARPDLPEYLRTCDLVVNLVSEIARINFSFSITTSENYTAAQLAEVRQYLRSRP